MVRLIFLFSFLFIFMLSVRGLLKPLQRFRLNLSMNDGSSSSSSSSSSVVGVGRASAAVVQSNTQKDTKKPSTKFDLNPPKGTRDFFPGIYICSVYIFLPLFQLYLY